MHRNSHPFIARTSKGTLKNEFNSKRKKRKKPEIRPEMTANMILVAVGILAAFYLFVCNRIIALIHPLRMQLAVLGEALCDTPGISDGFMIAFLFLWMVFIQRPGRGCSHLQCPLRLRWPFITKSLDGAIMRLILFPPTSVAT